VVPADQYFDKRVASANLSGYKWLRVDMWAYSTIHIDEGSIARNKTGYDGVVSPMYTLLNWRSSDHLPAYFEILLRSQAMLRRYRDNAQGSINRRRSLPWKTFAAMKVVVPPLKAQRRVVDLVSAADRAIAASITARDASERMMIELRESLLGAGSASATRLTSLGEELSQVRRPVQIDPAHTYREIGVRSHGRGIFVKDPIKGAELGTKRVFAMAPHELVFNIVFAWEGAVTVTGPDVAGLIASHRFPSFEGREEWTVDLIDQYLRTIKGRNLLVDCSPGGAGRNKTLTVSRLLSEQIKLPSDDATAQIVGTLKAASEQLEACISRVASLNQVRSELIEALVSGAHAIPASYDRLIEANAA
jgi:hypothetical protein